MVSPLAKQIKKAVAAGFAPIFLDATLTKEQPATGVVPFDPGPADKESYACKAVVETYSRAARDGGSVSDNERKVLILAGSVEVAPAPGDIVTVSGVSFAVVAVQTDPASAVWECRGRM